MYQAAFKSKIILKTVEEGDKAARQQDNNQVLIQGLLSQLSEEQEVPTENKLMIIFKNLNIKAHLADLHYQESLKVHQVLLINTFNQHPPWQLIKVDL